MPIPMLRPSLRHLAFIHALVAMLALLASIGCAPFDQWLAAQGAGAGADADAAATPGDGGAAGDVAGDNDGGGGTGAEVGAAGGLVFGSAGTALAVPPGAAGAGTTITLRAIDGAATGLPSEVTAVGGRHFIAASAPITAPANARLVVGLPIPVDPAGPSPLALGLAVEVTGNDRAPSWSILRGRFDEARGLLIARLPGIPTRGLTFQLVTGEFLESPRTTPLPADRTPLPQARRAALAPLAQVANPGAIDWRSGFAVKLIHGNGLPRPPAEAVEFYRRVLAEALTRLRASTLPPFALDLDWGEFWLELPEFFQPNLLYQVQLKTFFDVNQRSNEPCARFGGEGNTGTYNPTTETMIVCWPRTDETVDEPKLQDTVYHELFHAIQKRYFGMRMVEEIGQNLFFYEGTATLVAGSGAGAAARSLGQDRRPVDVDLAANEGLAPYEAQDFWLHAANQAGRAPLAFLEPFLLKADAGLPAIDEVLKGPPFETSLGAAHRRWVADQAVTNGCTVDADLASPMDLGTVALDPGTPELAAVQRGLPVEPLAARAVTFKVVNLHPRHAKAALRFDGAWASVPASGLNRVELLVKRAGGCTTSAGTPFPSGAAGEAALELELASGELVEVSALFVNDQIESEIMGALRIAELPPPADGGNPTPSPDPGAGGPGAGPGLGAGCNLPGTFFGVRQRGCIHRPPINGGVACDNVSGRTTFRRVGDTVTGTYEQGLRGTTFTGTVNGNTITGTWQEPTNALHRRGCRAGNFTLTFSDCNTFTGEWTWCLDTPERGGTWSGRRVSGLCAHDFCP